MSNENQASQHTHAQLPGLVLSFNNCVVDPERRELTLSGQLVDLQPLIFDLLLFLLENVNRVVTKEDMLKAAWRSTMVSDSVVARAVMKLRRAIGDDASQAKTVLTVHRVGYRFVANVRQVAPVQVLPQAEMPPVPLQAEVHAASGLALTTFENLSGDATLDALLPELDHVVRHLVADQVPLASVTGSDALQAWQAAAAEDDPLASACANLRVLDLAVVSVTRSEGQYTVRLLRGCVSDQATTAHFIGHDMLVLATRVAESLGGVMASTAAVSESEQEFWQAQYSRSVRLQRLGRADAALELLQLCRTHLVATPPMLLMQGRLHLAVREPEAARAEFEAAARQAQAEHLPGMEFEVHLAMAELAIAEGRPAAGLEDCLRALSILRANPQLAGEAPRLIMSFAQAMSEDSRGTEAINLAERAVATAQRLGLRSVEMSCRLGLGRTLLRFRQLHRASDVLRRLIDSAQPADDLVKLDGMLAMAEVERSQHRYLKSIEFARLARTLARRVKPTLVGQAIALELEGLIGSGQTDTVAQLLQQRWGFEDGLDPAAPPAVVQAHAIVMWRQGHAEQAMTTLKTLLDGLPESVTGVERTSLLVELCFMSASAGVPEGVAHWADQLRGIDSWLRARLQAAEALSRGLRDQARGYLAQAWQDGASNPWDSFDTGVDLAWMLLEDGNHDELERVIAQVLEVPSDHGPVRLLQAAYSHSEGGKDQQAQQWQRTIAMYPGLLRANPGMAKEMGREPLRELLTRACYR